MKTIRWLLYMLLLVTVACKKTNPIPEKKEDGAKTAMDISQYFIVMDYTFTLGGKSFIHPLLITFDQGGKSSFYDFAAVGNGQYDYVFADHV